MSTRNGNGHTPKPLEVAEGSEPEGKAARDALLSDNHEAIVEAVADAFDEGLAIDEFALLVVDPKDPQGTALALAAGVERTEIDRILEEARAAGANPCVIVVARLEATIDLVASVDADVAAHLKPDAEDDVIRLVCVACGGLTVATMPIYEEDDDDDDDDDELLS